MRLPKPNPGWLLPVAATALALMVLLLDPLPLRILRNAVFDQYQRWLPRAYQPVPVRIVDIDDASLARLGQWPWPRTRLAELTARLQEAGAAAIAFDVIFAEPDRTSPAAILGLWRPDADLRARIASLPDHDAAFATSIARGGVVLGHAMTRTGQAPAHFATPFRLVEMGPSPLPFLHPFTGSVAALPALQDAAVGNGAITFVPDPDGVVRRVPMLLRLGGQAVPSLAAEALRVGQGATNYLVKTSPEAGAGIE
jgi:adenylate cyclase